MAHTNIDLEVAVLRSWVDKSFDGSPLPGEAFGVGVGDRHLHQPVSLKAKDYNFVIYEVNGLLLLEIDAYTATHGSFINSDSFDVDAWEDAKLLLHVPTSRQGYQALHQASRILLKGEDVHLPSGEVIKGVVPC
jgi:hypothetical protein